MRINVYHEELTDEAVVVWTEPRPGTRYCGLRLFQKSAPELHHRPDDDDRSAITFWTGSLDEADSLISALQVALAAERARSVVPAVRPLGRIFRGTVRAPRSP